MNALLLSLVLLATPSATDLLRLTDTPAGTELPVGWELRPVSGVPVPDFSIRRDDDESVLRIDGTNAAAWAYRELDAPLVEEAGRLLWSWRALERPTGADLGRRSTDDSALRVYVVFGKPSLFSRPRVIFYSASDRDSAGTTRSAFDSDRIAIVAMDGGKAGPGSWRAESVQPFEDFRRVWGGEPPPIHLVGVMQDTDATGASASAELRALVWEPGEPATGDA